MISRARILPKLLLNFSLKFELNFSLEHSNSCNFVLSMAHISAAARAK